MELPKFHTPTSTPMHLSACTIESRRLLQMSLSKQHCTSEQKFPTAALLGCDFFWLTTLLPHLRFYPKNIWYSFVKYGQKVTTTQETHVLSNNNNAPNSSRTLDLQPITYVNALGYLNSMGPASHAQRKYNHEG